MAIPPPTQFIYQSIKAGAGGSTDAIILATEGTAGNFNRAMRAADNFRETLPPMLVAYAASCLVAPRTATVIMLVNFVGRIANVLGYTRSTGARMFGFVISTIALNAMSGIVVRAAYIVLKREMQY